MYAYVSHPTAKVTYAYVSIGRQGRSGVSTTKRRARKAWGTLTREQVVNAAEQRVRSDPPEAFSIRSLAADLGVAPMSIYNHVRDKDDLLEEVVDRLLATRWEPATGRGDWTAWVEEAAERLRDLLITEPVALHVYLAHPVTSPNAILRMEAMLEVLIGAGFAPDAAQRAYAALHTYTVGFAALEASRAKSPASNEDPLESKLARFTTADQFREGLRYLVAGFADKEHASSTPRRRLD